MSSSIEKNLFSFLQGKSKAQGVEALFDIMKGQIGSRQLGMFDMFKGPYHGKGRREGSSGNYRYYYNETSAKRGKASKYGSDDPVGKGKFYKKLLSLGFVDRIEHLPADTRDAHMVNGEWSAARKKKHKEWAATFLAQGKVVPKNVRPVAVVTMGGPGSGKSSAMEGIDLNNFVPVDPDAAKQLIPEYQEATNMKYASKKGEKDKPLKVGAPRALNAALMAHEESSSIAKLVRETAISQNKNVLLDGTGKNLEKMTATLKLLRKQGYHIKLTMPHIPLVEGKKRVAIRAEHTGRFVPDSIVDEAYTKIPYNFTQLRDLADEAFLYDNSGPFGSSATLMYTQDAQGATVNDPKLYERFQRYAKPY